MVRENHTPSFLSSLSLSASLFISRPPASVYHSAVRYIVGHDRAIRERLMLMLFHGMTGIMSEYIFELYYIRDIKGSFGSARSIGEFKILYIRQKGN